MLRNLQAGLLLAMAICFGTCAGSTAFGDDGHAEQVLKRFTTHLDQLSGSDIQRQAARAALDAELQRGSGPGLAIGQALLAWNPEYRAAVDLADSGQFAQALSALEPFLDSTDQFIAADAEFVLARAFLDYENFEAAAPLLTELLAQRGEHSANLAQAQYFLGMTQAKLLRNADAIDSFSEFLQRYPSAPERLRVNAWQQIQELSAVIAGQLTDVHQRMDYSRRKLSLQDSGDGTQEQQDKIVDLLAKLIREQEKRECSSSNSKQNTKEQNQQAQLPQQRPDNPQQSQSQTGGVSNNPNGVAQRVFSDGPASPWSKLRDRTRDPAYSAIKDQLPAKYRDIVERYTEKAQSSSSDTRGSN